MSLGLNSKFNILQQSPHDTACSSADAAPVAPEIEHWVPSRYTVRAATDDGQLILWNTFRGTMSVFKPEQKPVVERFLRRPGYKGPLEGAVKYLQQRGFVVKAGTDEYRQFQLAFGRQHYRNDLLQLILLASEDCNFRCTYCYEDFARGTMRPEVRAGIKKLVEKRAGGLRSLSVNWFGGEPLYGLAAIEDLGPFFVGIAEEHSLFYSSNMTTNGYLLTPDVAENLLAWNVRRYQITIDGPPESHNKSRPTRTGEGSFDTILTNLKAMSEREDEFEIHLRVNYDRQNYPRMNEFFDVLERDLGGDSRFKLRFRGVGKWGGPNDKDLDVCSGDESARVQWELKEEALRRGLSLSDGLRNVKGIGAEVCYAARPYNFIIGASGKVMKCTIDLDTKDRNVVGKLTEDGELVLDADKMALWTEPAFEQDGKCQKCVILPACEGLHCPQVRMDYNRSPCTPLRKNFKKEMHQLRQEGSSNARTVRVNREGAAKVVVQQSSG